MQPEASDIWDVPDQWRVAAEEVRAHLCSLRGGALFLSPNDTLVLVQWLEQGVPVPDIFRALERAADARSKRRGRYPVSLSRARQHLGRPTRGVALPPPTGAQPFGPVAQQLRTLPQTEALGTLRTSLLAIEDEGEDGLRKAVAHVRTYLDTAWAQLGDAERQELRSRAETSLGDLVEYLDEATLEALIDEESRTLFRQQIPCTSVASLWELVQSDGS